MCHPAAGSPGPVGPTLVPEGFGMEKRLRSFLASHPHPGQVTEGSVCGPRPPGRRGEQVRTQLWPAGLPEVFRASLALDPPSSVLRGPHKPPCPQLLRTPSLPPAAVGGRSSEDALSPALPSSWRTEGKRGTAVRQPAGGKGVLQNWGRASKDTHSVARQPWVQILSPLLRSCMH